MPVNLRKAFPKLCLLVIMLSLPAKLTAKEKLWSGSVAANYHSDTQQANPMSSLSASLAHTGGSNTLFVSQGINKPSYIYPGESEINLTDTEFGLSRPLPEWVKGMSFALSLRATLPISEYSRTHEIYTRPRLGVSVSESFFDQRLNFSYGAAFETFISKYQSEATGDGRGGRPLPKYRYGVSTSGSYRFHQAFAAGYGLSYNETYYYSLDPVASEALTANELPTQTYNVSMSLNWRMSSKWSADLGLSQGSQILHQGTVDLVLYDQDASIWFIRTQYSY